MDQGKQPAIAARARRWWRGLWPDGGGTADELYHALVNAARTPVFYRDLGVPDTAEGRFEMVGLHVALAVRRLRAAEPPADALAQELFDLMFADMDESLRHLGVGDLKVGGEIKRLAAQFYARLSALDAAFQGEPADRLRTMVRTNVYHGGAAPSARQLAALVAHIVAVEQTLRTQSSAAVASGRIALAPPRRPADEPPAAVPGRLRTRLRPAAGGVDDDAKSIDRHRTEP
jgi:cytochrome b pre-mRNA-processing protein 3